MSFRRKAPFPDARFSVIAGLLVVALNLRPAITSVSPVLQPIGEYFGFSSTAEGVLTTLPVLCLGLAAPLAPRLSRLLGVKRTIWWVLVVLALALLARPYLGAAGLFAGTLVAGCALGVIGILLPGIVKQEFPRHVGLMTGLYTATLSVGAATAAGITEPLRLAFGGSWQSALAFWLLPALLAAVVWLPQARPAVHTTTRPPRFGRLLRDRLAWQVTAYMGFQSALAYIVFGWLPTILMDRGLTPVAAGLALSASILVQIGSAIAAPWIGSLRRDQRSTIATLLTLTLIGLAGCLYAPLGGLWLWILILGIGQGGTFSMALTLLALRAPDATRASQLSAMAQGFGYVLAAAGPLAAGLIHDWSGSWAATGPLFGAIGVLALIFGLGAGRDRRVAP